MYVGPEVDFFFRFQATVEEYNLVIFIDAIGNETEYQPVILSIYAANVTGLNRIEIEKEFNLGEKINCTTSGSLNR